jgi:tRNA-dihydrouridine synthase C
VFWKSIGAVRRSLGIPVVANGDIFSLEDFLCCRDETECEHFMIGHVELTIRLFHIRLCRRLALQCFTQLQTGHLS